MITIKRLQDIRQEQALKEGKLQLAVGGFSSTPLVRKQEGIPRSVPEADSRPRSAIGYQDGKLLLINTQTRRDMSLPKFGKRMDEFGLTRSQWLFVDGGSSAQCYYYNGGKPVYLKSSTKVPLFLQVQEGKYEVTQENDLIICRVAPEHCNLFNKVTTAFEEPKFSGMNVGFFNKDFSLLSAAYDRGNLIYPGVGWVPPRACLLITKEAEAPQQPLSLEARMDDFERRLLILEGKK